MSGNSSKNPSGHPPGSKFRLYVKDLDENGNPVFENCGWISVDPRVEVVKGMSDAKVFTSREKGHGSAEDWLEFFRKEEPEWNISISWVSEKASVKRSGSARS